MGYRLEYISKLFQKAGKKKIETYVISRIWHLLSDNEIKFVPQQYVKRDNEKYALTDLYLPQIGLHIEINEPAHYCSDERIDIDIRRKEEIEKATNHYVRVVDCREGLDEIHSQIDVIVDEIKQKIATKRKDKLFVPWEEESQFTPDYHKRKGVLKVEDNPCLRTVDDICELFDVAVPKRGFLRGSGIMHPKRNDIFVWWPVENHKNWDNQLADDKTILERHRNQSERKKHTEACINSKEKRAVFFGKTDVLGFKFYRFKGIFEIDKEKSNIEQGLVWRMTESELEI